MNTILKVSMLCLICLAVVMSGCMESKDGQSSDGGSDLPITLFVDIGSVYGADDSNVRLIILEEDGTAEFCSGDGTGTDVCTYGTWEKHGSSGREYDVTSWMLNLIHVTILDDGIAELETFDMVLEGTWTKGADR
jgi:hypothetical protein